MGIESPFYVHNSLGLSHTSLKALDFADYSADWDKSLYKYALW